MKNVKVFVCVLFISCVHFIAYSQVSLKNNIPTFICPDAGSLGQYGQVPVSLYNGLPDITIPIYTIKTRSLQVPISLKYYAEGNRVDDHPGWVGLGWSLHAGGVITRITNGLQDETDSYELLYLTKDSFTSPYYGYYFRSNDFTSTWTTSFISDSLYLNNGTFNASYYEMDTEPDEFLVSCDGFSASLYFYRTSSNAVAIKIKSQDGQVVKAEAYAAANNQIMLTDTNSSSINVNSYTSFIEFKLTTLDGTQYIFGGNNFNAIDCTISVDPATLSNKVMYSPTAWYLTKIISPSNDTILFDYMKENTPIAETRRRYAWAVNDTPSDQNSSSSNGSSEYSYSVLYPSHLADIKWSNGGKITFTASSTHELTAISNTDQLNQQIINPVAGDVGFDLSTLNYYLKLDQININNQLLFKLQYNDNPSQRLKLLSFTCTNTNNLKQYSYSFGYNPNLLPAYNSDETDNWGSYNGKYYGATPFSALYAFRTPNATLMQAEMLDTITYPTGGKAIFQYEPNDFSRIVNYQQDLTLNTPFNLKDSTGIAGGLRIKQITYQFKDASTPTIIKQYEYKNADLTSSGILSNIPIYNIGGSASGSISSGSTWLGNSINISYNYIFTNVSENPVNYLDRTNGNPVTYSRVIEKLQDNSQTVYTYTNYNDFPDLTPLSIYTTFNQNLFINKVISRNLERGLLLKTEYYNGQGNLLKKIENQYNNDPSRYNDYVKSIYKYKLGSILYRFCAITIYTFYPYLKTQTETQYNLTIGDSIQQKMLYTYGANNLVNTITSINSHGDTLQTSMNYTGNYPVAPYTGMYQKFMVNYPVEITHFDKHRATAGSLTMYKQVINNSDTLYLPDKTYSLDAPTPLTSFTPFNGTSMDSHYDSTPEATFLSYDAKGNVREVKNRTGISTTYLWGYNYQYPIASIQNATFSQVQNALGMSNVDSQLSAPDMPDTSKTNVLRKQLPQAMVSIYTYQPLIGMISMTTPQGVTTHYTYDILERLFQTMNDDKNILARYRYGYYNASDNGMGGYTALSGTITPGSSSYTVGYAGSATVSASGGSGNYTYNWYLKNSSGTILASSLNATSTSFSFTCSQTGTLILQCQIIDSQTGENTTLSQNITCNAGLSAAISSGVRYTQNVICTATISASGGSGNYYYSWSLLDSSGLEADSKAGTTATQISFVCTDPVSFTLKCTVTDTQNGQSITATHGIIVISNGSGPKE